MTRAWAGHWRARVHYIVFTAPWNATRMSRTSCEARVHHCLHPSLSTMMLLKELLHHMWPKTPKRLSQRTMRRGEMHRTIGLSSYFGLAVSLYPVLSPS
ncbi:hypothetical protein K503DRAFT_777501 [Rhizopogon vinicolor AM-OR11-026]|uniref:Uncharacterized protein n=1 Tax=Rhizopogon vinicolor AM-OR11-026 TaxID=1314800 RepID=A0A1B7MG01_9AGAM|nr:hypothetical protein K503DRAFT_777501 [Rhizopogon vinicolor AM-OR11-026]